MRKFATLFAMLMLCSALAFGQHRMITGTVTDETGTPLPGATVMIKGKTNTSVAADNNGQFRLMANTGEVILVSGAGLAPTEMTIDANSNFTISVKRNVITQTEVVVTALGTARQPKELGYSVAKVKANELTQAKVVNIANGLTAKVSGLNVATTNSSVFGDVRMTLRGIRSLTGNNQPMLVVDGVPMALGFLKSINPNDIDNVSILKSASGTAVYGPDGVNGAIIVTTKRGNKARPVITVSHTTQLEKISYMPEFQERFGGGYTPDNLGYGIYESIEQQSWGDEFDGSIRQIGQDGPNGEKYMVPYSYVKNGRRDWFNTGVTNQTDVSYAAGDFYISAQNVGIKGTMPGDELFRRSITLRADKEYGKFRAGFSLRYTQSQFDVTNNQQVVYYGVTGSPGQIPISRFADWRHDYFSSPDGYYTPYLDNNGKTPYFAKDNYRSIGNGDEFFGNGELNFQATSWLRFTYRVGFTFDNAEARATRGAFQYSAYHLTLRDHGSLSITSAVADASTVNQRLTSEFFINANKRWGKFGTTLLLGQTYRESEFHTIQNGSNNLGNAQFLTIQLRKGEPNATIDNSKTRLERYFYKVGIDYNNWAFLETTGSYDFDSRLAKPEGIDKKSDIAFFYPGVSLSVMLSEAIPSIKNSKTISYLKVRGAITKTGNAVIPVYAFETPFVAGTFFPYGDVLGFQSTLSSNSLDLQPEFVLNREAGFDIGFLKNRINFEFSYYNQDNTGQVVGVQLSNTTGITTATQNAARFFNDGLEFDLRLTPLVKIKNVNINLSANYAHQWSEVTEIAGSVTELGIGNFNYAIVGFPAYVFKLTDYDRDDQGRVIVGADGMPTQKTGLTQFGQTQPTDLLGINLNVTWKNLTFSAVADYRTGNQIVADQLGGFLDDNGISKRSGQNGRRAFIFPNSVIADPANPGKYIPNTNVYTQLYGRLFWNSDLNTSVISNYLADGSFWKLREVAINYDMPLAKMFGTKFTNTVKAASITLSGRNLLMWLPDSNQWTDPEFQGGNGNSSYTGNATGRSTAFNFPPTRTFGATLSVRF